MDAVTRRKITQTTGAKVVQVNDGRKGIVSGHYDDDVVFVQWGNRSRPEAEYTEYLRLEDD